VAHSPRDASPLAARVVPRARRRRSRSLTRPADPRRSSRQGRSDRPRGRAPSGSPRRETSPHTQDASQRRTPPAPDRRRDRRARPLPSLWVPRTSSTSRNQVILVDQTTDASLSSDAVLLKIDRFGQRFQRRCRVQGTVRPVLIMVVLVVAQDLLQMALVPDKGAVQELASASPDPAFGNRVHAERLHVAHGPDPGISEDRVECGGEVRATVADMNFIRSACSPRSMIRLRACWVVHSPVGYSVTPRMRMCRAACPITVRPWPPGGVPEVCVPCELQRWPASAVGHHDHPCPCACSISSSSGSAAGWSCSAGHRHQRTPSCSCYGTRPHRSLLLHPPRPDHPVADLSQERIKRWPVLGGLINEYERAA